MTDSKDNKDYEIGYGKPPKKNQFKPGQSGNYKGRYKASEKCNEPKNLHELILINSLIDIKITERNKIKNVKVLEVIAKKVISGALQGDALMIKLFIKMFESKSMDKAINKYILDNTPIPQVDKNVQELVDELRKIAIEMSLERQDSLNEDN